MGDDELPRGADRDPGTDVEARRVGLCARCAHARKITSGKGSVFWMCQAPGLPKYPPLPVSRCSAFTASAIAPCLLLVALALGGLAACAAPAPTSGSAATVDVPAPLPPPTSAPPAGDGAKPAEPAPGGGAKPDAALVGVWTSPSCGARTYERILALGADGAFTATDRVSPCPPGARCVWAGIVVREGTWKASGSRIAITIAAGDAKGAGQPLPSSLLVDGGAPVEEDGAIRCAYARK